MREGSKNSPVSCHPEGQPRPSARKPDPSPRARLRGLLDHRDPLVVPFAYDALSARLIEEAGFQAIGISGSAVAASLLAQPDVGLLSRHEVVSHAHRIASTVPRTPVIADADTGFGDCDQAALTLADFEDAGVAGIFIEDQGTPKRCGHLSDLQVIAIEEMVSKIKAALRARRDPDFVLIARTDAITIEGLAGAAERARAYLEAGSDLAFVSAPRTREELERLPHLVKGPLMVVLTEGGRTPLLSTGELGELGYKLIGFSGITIGLAARAIQRGLAMLRARGGTADLLSETMGLDERNRLLGLEAPHEEGY